MIVLGIESTAHTIGLGAVDDEGNILLNEWSTYIPPSGVGIHPREAAEHHVKAASELLRRAAAVIDLGKVSGVAFSQGPGLGPALRVGATIARTLALRLGKPLIPVHHGVAHVEIARLATGAVDPLVLLVSGGHTMVLAHSGDRYRVFGETLDIAVGNCIDMFAREAGFGFPGVPRVEECAAGGSRYIEMPYNVAGQDVYFAGIYTRAVEALRRGERKEDVCLSFIETVYYMLAEVVERGLALTGKRGLVVAGGVARSRRLVDIMRVAAEEFNASLHVVPHQLAGDNGAMIAWVGLLSLMSGVTARIEDSTVRQRWRIDEVTTPWFDSSKAIISRRSAAEAMNPSND
ncbi:protein kinase [Thermocladium modestius]|uniref:tRNA N6-adenosine threonylcarbamoyltransferase n=1 Tax=Thermocladium modestius TaxID=62609 RepID=A0A830GWV7_9CREN|nr:KEOPS complex N(6)-L-threonylcarbamoyladenine synthase Kae1 [Thermocladium modestius]GGP22517.1 protein kinase [Thermocladium modestius]